MTKARASFLKVAYEDEEKKVDNAEIKNPTNLLDRAINRALTASEPELKFYSGYVANIRFKKYLEKQPRGKYGSFKDKVHEYYMPCNSIFVAYLRKKANEYPLTDFIYTPGNHAYHEAITTKSDHIVALVSSVNFYDQRLGDCDDYFLNSSDEYLRYSEEDIEKDHYSTYLKTGSLFITKKKLVEEKHTLNITAFGVQDSTSLNLQDINGHAKMARIWEILLDQQRTNKRIVVHCHAGIGRTGHFIFMCKVLKYFMQIGLDPEDLTIEALAMKFSTIVNEIRGINPIMQPAMIYTNGQFRDAILNAMHLYQFGCRYGLIAKNPAVLGCFEPLEMKDTPVVTSAIPKPVSTRHCFFNCCSTTTSQPAIVNIKPPLSFLFMPQVPLELRSEPEGKIELFVHEEPHQKIGIIFS